MTAFRLSVGYLGCLVVLIVADLALVARRLTPFGRGPLSGAMFDRMNLPAALLHYLIYTSGLVFFGVWPAVALHQTWLAPLGGLAYGATAAVGFALTGLKLRERVSASDMLLHGALAAIAALAGLIAAEGLA